jgi:type IV secretory pathway component VirB8
MSVFRQVTVAKKHAKLIHMKPAQPHIPDDAAEIAKNIRSGEFFRESMQDYHTRYHDIISERYFYLGIMSLILVILTLVWVSIAMLHPLKTRVPFIYSTQDIVDDLPSMRKIGQSGVDPNVPLKQFMLANYVKLREEYSIDTLDRSANGIKSQSTDEVFNAYQQTMDPRNADSPIAQFQRQAVRQIQVTGFQQLESGENERVSVNFTAIVTSQSGTKKTPMRAIISFRFDEIEVDQKTGKTTPLGFIVTQYKSEPLSS